MQILIILITILISNFVERTLQRGEYRVVLKAVPICPTNVSTGREEVTVDVYHIGAHIGNVKVLCGQLSIININEIDGSDLTDNQIKLEFRYKSGKLFTRFAEKDCKPLSKQGNTFTCTFTDIDPTKY